MLLPSTREKVTNYMKSHWNCKTAYKDHPLGKKYILSNSIEANSVDVNRWWTRSQPYLHVFTASSIGFVLEEWCSSPNCKQNSTGTQLEKACCKNHGNTEYCFAKCGHHQSWRQQWSRADFEERQQCGRHKKASRQEWFSHWKTQDIYWKSLQLSRTKCSLTCHWRGNILRCLTLHQTLIFPANQQSWHSSFPRTSYMPRSIHSKSQIPHRTSTHPHERSFRWNHEQEKAFKEIKRLICGANTLTYPSKPTQVDASLSALQLAISREHAPRTTSDEHGHFDSDWEPFLRKVSYPFHNKL